MRAPALVDVCVATFRRPHMLAQLLASLSRQEGARGLLKVIVVDNDEACSAQSTVEACAHSGQLDVEYHCEPVRGISAARNRALAHASAEFVAFVDDDETVPNEWLGTMLAACRAHRADAVFGPVESVMPPGCPKWVLRHRTFRRATRSTGTVMTHGACNNVLLRSSALGDPRQTFDNSYGLTGGEDTEFFYRLHRAGRRFVWCDEAAVFEHVHPSRLTLTWLSRRAFRSGQTFVRIFVRPRGPAARWTWFLGRCVRLAAAVSVAPVARLASYSLYMSVVACAWRTWGQLAALAGGKPYEEYNVASRE